MSNIIEFKPELLEDKQLAVHCNTEEKANALLKWASSKGLTWKNGRKFTSYNNWNKYGSDTYYRVLNGTFGLTEGHKKHNHKIISYEDALLKKPKVKPYKLKQY